MLLMNLTQETHFRPLEPMKSSLFWRAFTPWTHEILSVLTDLKCVAVVKSASFTTLPHGSHFPSDHFRPKSGYSDPKNGHFALQNGHSEAKSAAQARHLTVNLFSYLLTFRKSVVTFKNSIGTLYPKKSVSKKKSPKFNANSGLFVKMAATYSPAGVQYHRRDCA